MNIEIVARGPIAHGEFSDGIDLGNIMCFRHMPVLQNGEIYNVPVISGNAIRGTIRRALMTEIVDRFDLKTRMGKTFDKFYIAVANGGNLDKNMDVSVDTEHLRDIRAVFPALSLLGASMYKYMMPGMVNVGFAIPRCLELGTGTVSLDSITTDIGLTRHIDRTVAETEDAKPMPYTVEAIIPGTVFDMTINLAPQSTELEKSCLNHGIKLLKYIGGKHGAGFGEIFVSGYGDDALYIEWLDNAENASALEQLAEEMQ